MTQSPGLQTEELLQFESILLSHAGATGLVEFDNAADREPDYSLWSLSPDSETYEVYATLKMTERGSEEVNNKCLPPKGQH